MIIKGFRCPSCGQAHKMVSEKDELTMNKEMTILSINGQPFKEGQLVSVINEDLYVTCPECGGTGTTKDWIRAFDDPTIFFEMDTLCHCGGELWMDQIPMSNQYGFVCEQCNWVKPNTKVSGA